MSDIINQIQNIKLELKTLEMQFDNIIMQMQNMIGMQNA